ncbi:recombinase family protein [Anaerotignum sp.]|uniref:recombinase family protein n=1 Tax=Anaerotignum sp. TaxID=2039241 RepID=UPI0028ACD7E5|nr:recombinase family protein [Anaerotignum sp.]
MSKKYKAALYMRISNSDEKRGESESLSNQRKLLEDFLVNYPDIEVVSEKLDDGYTGLLFDRPAFKEMMQEIVDEKVNCVIVKDLSRLGREFIETGNYLRTIFPQYGVRFIAVSDGVDTAKDEDLSGHLDVTVKTLMNDAYSQDISKKTRSALQTKRNSGEFVGACPVYGYKRCDEQKNILVIDDYAAEVVRDIFKMKKDGMSAARIADKLNERGILSPFEYKKDRGLPTPKGGFADNENSKWSATTIIRMLKDETYIGTLIQGKQTTFSYKLKNKKDLPKEEWAVAHNAHEPIISRQDFDLVQKLMNIDTRIAPNEDSVYLFSGILICGCCGTRMTRKTVPYKDKKYYYYYCPKGKKNGCIGSKMIKETDLVECIAGSIKQHIDNVVNLDELLTHMGERAIVKKVYEKYTVQLQDVQKQIDTITHFKAGLYEGLLNEILSKEEYAYSKKGYDEEFARLTHAKALIITEFEQAKANEDEKMRWMEHFKSFREMTSLSRSAVIQLIQHITIGESKEIHIKFRYQSDYQNALRILSPQRKAV